MIKNHYVIDGEDWFNEGGCCQFYPIKDHPELGFKEFNSRTKKKAEYAHSVQKKLSKFDLAPRVYSEVCKLKFFHNGECLEQTSNWGYVTELANMDYENHYSSKQIMKKIQKLVGEIYDKTKLKFWDCHYSNVATINRSGKIKLVCIDTGKESFDGYANAWGFADPGPKCCYCLRYQCKCG